MSHKWKATPARECMRSDGSSGFLEGVCRCGSQYLEARFGGMRTYRANGSVSSVLESHKKEQAVAHIWEWEIIRVTDVLGNVAMDFGPHRRIAESADHCSSSPIGKQRTSIAAVTPAKNPMLSLFG